MPIEMARDHAMLLIRRPAFEQAGMSRAVLDERLGLTADEFRVEGDLIAVGPLPPETDVSGIVSELEEAGLTYFDDFFDLSGNWPSWLSVFAMAARR